jgi:multiple sugar transport system substrate-binding protein
MSHQIRSERSSRSYSRRQVMEKGALGTGAVLGLGPFLAACGGSGSSSATSGGGGGGGGPITIGSFADAAMVPFRDDFLKKYQQETGNEVQYNETNYDAWYQNSKNDGLQKTGAYDIYVMDDNWVPEFAAAGIVQSMDSLGVKVNPDILAKGLEQGYWPPKSGPRLKAFESDDPQLYALVIIDDVQMLYYNTDHFSSAPATWDDIYAVAKTTTPPSLYGWTARGVAGNPIVQTYLPLLNAYGGNFVNEDWSPGFDGPEGVGALERLFSFIPYMPPGVAAFDTDQETALFLQGKATAMTEYTGAAHGVDDPSVSKVVKKVDFAATPAQEKSGPAIGTFICGIASGAKNPEGAVAFLEWFTSDKVQKEFAAGGSAAVTGSALRDAELAKTYRWLPAVADAVDNSVPKPKTPDEPKMEDLLGTALNQALVEAVSKKSGYTEIAQSHLTTAANQISAYLKQQGTYF